jgi:two-component system, LytTR family, response regulator
MGSVSQVENQMPESGTLTFIRTVIADDDDLARKKLRLLLDRIGNFEVVMECRDGRQTIAAVASCNPDLLLLDIQMPDLDGFEVLNAIDAQRRLVVVFTTAYDRYAIRAFEANALDYLLKPFDEDRLRRTMAKVRNELEKEQARVLAKQMVSLFADAATPNESLPQSNRLVIKSGGRVIFLDLDDVDWIEAAANNVRFHVGKESYILRGSIGLISTRLDSRRFVRVHRSAIVNVDKIKELQPCNAGEYMVVLKSGKTLPCSRSYRESLRQFINKV